MTTSYLARRIKFRTNIKGRFFLWEIIIELISRFPITLDEAIALVNRNWAHTELANNESIIYHELPEFWAKQFYWGQSSFWWKKGEARKQRGLSALKPEKNKKLEKYYVCSINTGELQNSYEVVLSQSSIAAFKLLGLIDNDDKLGYCYPATNYNDALKKHYRRSGRGEYREVG